MLLTPGQIRHLHLRAGFGLPVKELFMTESAQAEVAVSELFLRSEKSEDIDFIPDPLKGRDKEVSNFGILAMILRSKTELQNLNFQWLYRLGTTEAGLREKMTLFWHNHFATSVPFSYLMQVQNNMLRRHALGKFSTLLKAVSKDPAMILYLNNQENKKDHPNENFARELLELFTLGIGNYTEADIREAARAFTGWAIDRRGRFAFNEEQHDVGVKSFMGQTGNYGGEDIIDIVLKNKRTYRFITEKIFKAFINPEPDNEWISQLTDDFFLHDDISLLMKSILTDERFYAGKNIGCIISSPAELLARYIKLFRIEFESPLILLELQQALGQTLFFPPNVAGWPGGRAWIDTSSLLLRTSLPELFLTDGFLSVSGRPEFEETDQKKLQRTPGSRVFSSWKELENAIQVIQSDNFVTEISRAFLQTALPSTAISMLVKESSDRKKCIIRLLSQPEFQLI